MWITAFEMASRIFSPMSSNGLPINRQIWAFQPFSGGNEKLHGISRKGLRVCAFKLQNISHPSKGRGHYGIYRNWWVALVSPTIHAMAGRSGCKAHFPAAQTICTGTFLSRPLQQVTSEGVAPLSIQKSSASFPSFTGTRVSTGHALIFSPGPLPSLSKSSTIITFTSHNWPLLSTNSTFRARPPHVQPIPLLSPSLAPFFLFCSKKVWPLSSYTAPTPLID